MESSQRATSSEGVVRTGFGVLAFVTPDPFALGTPFAPARAT